MNTISSFSHPATRFFLRLLVHINFMKNTLHLNLSFNFDVNDLSTRTLRLDWNLFVDRIDYFE